MRRRCFLPPIPEFAVAADHLHAAADAFLGRDFDTCRHHLRASNIRALREFAYLVAGPINPAIHRQSHSPRYVKPTNLLAQKMPPVRVQREIMARDGYRCRYCGSRVIVREAQRIFTSSFPDVAPWGKTNNSQHFALATLRASIDHITPRARGGDNSEHNLVTACGPCQYGRNQWTLEEVEIEDPRQFPALVDEWDGLKRLAGCKVSAAV